MRAAQGDVVHAGDQLTATSVTKLTTVSQPALAGTSGSSTGVQGSSSSGLGVAGGSNSYIGIYGISTSDVGVWGDTHATDRAAIFGRGYGNSTGVVGSSGTVIPAAKAKTGVYGYAAQDSGSKALFGESPTGWAGYFAGKVYVSKFQEMREIGTPAAPGANKARLFVRDNGSGKSQLCVRFTTGGVLVLKTQP